MDKWMESYGYVDGVVWIDGLSRIDRWIESNR